jgi:hypothetical protein
MIKRYYGKITIVYRFYYKEMVMIQRNVLYAIVGLLCLTVPSIDGGFIDLTLDLQIQTCTGANSICTQSGKVNAINEKATFEAADVTDKGELKGEEKITFDLPLVDNAVKAYTFKPTTGERAGQEIEIAFRKVAPQMGKRGESGLKQLVIFYRKGDKADEWLEFGRAGNKKDVVLKSLTFDVNDSGRFVIKGPTGDRAEYYVGDKVLKARVVQASE